METKLGHERTWTVAFYELIGTALFTYCIIVSGADALAVAFSLFTQIIIFGSVTGGHFNPAVTLGVLVWQLKESSNSFVNFLLAVMMIVGQIVGSLVGAIIAGTALKVQSKVPEEYIPILAPQSTVSTAGFNGFSEDF